MKKREIKSEDTNKMAVLIPAYEPDEKMLPLVKKLVRSAIPVLVVDDGGGKSFLELFERAKNEGCVVLHHKKNRGKGAALKTGLKYLADQGYKGAVTADADGQHSCKDILRVARTLKNRPRFLVLGVRDIAQMPAKSKAGNSLTKWLFSVMYGVKITDTQTGLRGIPIMENIDDLLKLEGERYEYEMNTLIFANKLFDGLKEVKIKTIYFDNNSKSHFRPLKDGMKIYSLLFKHFPKFVLSSMLAFLIDYSLFILFFYRLGLDVVLCTVMARIISASVNFNVNKRLVFKSKSKQYTAAKYFGLAILILTLNSGLIFLLVDVLHIPAYIGKLLVEAALYFISFAVQNRLVHQK